MPMQKGDADHATNLSAIGEERSPGRRIRPKLNSNGLRPVRDAAFEVKVGSASGPTEKTKSTRVRGPSTPHSDRQGTYHWQVHTLSTCSGISSMVSLALIRPRKGSLATGKATACMKSMASLRGSLWTKANMIGLSDRWTYETRRV